MNMRFETNNDNHDYDTRQNDRLRTAKPATEGGRKSLRNSIPRVMNSLTEPLSSSIYGKSCKTLAYQFKSNKIACYNESLRCNDASCYPCSIVFS